MKKTEVVCKSCLKNDELWYSEKSGWCCTRCYDEPDTPPSICPYCMAPVDYLNYKHHLYMNCTPNQTINI